MWGNLVSCVLYLVHSSNLMFVIAFTLKVGSWTRWCKVFQFWLSKQNWALKSFIHLKVLWLTSLLKTLSSICLSLSPVLPPDVGETYPLSFLLHRNCSFSFHTCWGACHPFSLTFLVLSWFYLLYVSLGCTLWFRFVPINSQFKSNKIRVEHCWFVVKSLITPCVSTLCVKIELISLVF